MDIQQEVDSFLASSTPDVRALALQARALVLNVIPDAIEMVDLPAKLIGYGYNRGYSGMICAVALQKSYVNLMFSRGTELPDPGGLLEGTGKRARHVKLRTGDDVDKPETRRLVEIAAQMTRQALDAKPKR